MSLTVIRPGLFTTVQDRGRFGFQKHGVIVGGVMDPFAYKMANLLVGNKGTEAAVEMTMKGDTWEVTEDTVLAICGADMEAAADDKPLPLWKPVWVRAGTVIRFGVSKLGARTYIAVAGGVQCPLVMNSRSTYARAGIGGYEGRALQKGDELKADEPGRQSKKLGELLQKQAKGGAFYAPDWRIAADHLPRYHGHPVVRVVKGNQSDWFTEESRNAFFGQEFRVSPQSDRMGYRLEGPRLEKLDKSRELVSEAVTFGTVQVPAEGNPIVLLADRQTTGGYPKIAQIISVDLPLIVQTKPGDVIRFREVVHQEAERLLLEREQLFRQVRLGMKLKYE
ncbi:5-oxoprolinase/urea amidolyase family protein [Brevibacillus borstelensis]|uniref:5-oxoprolinase subunit C family protein n=1 Tax=Brevibacillus borstelensis TaxID=45462 RepID=UPI0030C0BB0A